MPHCSGVSTYPLYRIDFIHSREVEANLFHTLEVVLQQR